MQISKIFLFNSTDRPRAGTDADCTIVLDMILRTFSYIMIGIFVSTLLGTAFGSANVLLSR